MPHSSHTQCRVGAILAAIVMALLLACCGEPQSEGDMDNTLVQAAGSGDNQRVRQLLASGAAINAMDQRGRTPVLAATHGGYTETVRLLIEAGADIDQRDQRSDNVLLYAGASGMLDIVRLAIAA
ncbi:MAG TPA: ankyrin repeat domain-containing protein, partial [Roseiflexaceae bacterium]|nr:ankyrin repeat domain-containing protein [Roseiflexaceae bacterium]